MELKQYTEDLCYVEFNLFYFTWKYVGNMLKAKLAVLGQVIMFSFNFSEFYSTHRYWLTEVTNKVMNISTSHK